MINILANTVGRDAAEIRITDSSNVDVGASESAGKTIISGGARYLRWTQSGTAERRVVYINTNGGLDFTHVFIRNADWHSGQTVDIVSWSSYPSTMTTEMSSVDLDSYLVGPNTLDAVVPLTVDTSPEAVGIVFPSAYETKVGQIYFCQAVQFDALVGEHTGEVLPETEPQRQHWRKHYEIEEQATIMLDGDQSDVDGLADLPKREPIVLYDDSGSGGVGHGIADLAAHCLLTRDSAEARADDSYLVALDYEILREYV